MEQESKTQNLQNQNIKVQVSPIMTRERNGWVSPELTASLLKMSQDERCTAFDYSPRINYYSSQEARNAAALEFLEGDCDWLLMIDNDTCSANPQTGEIVNYIDMIAGADPAYYTVIGAPVPVIRHRQWHINAYRHCETGFEPLSLRYLENRAVGGEYVNVGAVGFGVVAIHREALQAVSDSAFQWDEKGAVAGKSDSVAFTRRRKDNGSTILGEDMQFCVNARRLGYEVYSHLPSFSGHYHTVNFGEMPAIYFYIEGMELFGLESWPAITPYTMEFGSLKWLYHYIRQEKPSKVVELGSGLSTLVIAAACKDYGCVVDSYEQDSQEFNKIKLHLGANSLYDNRCLLAVFHSPLNDRGFYEDLPRLEDDGDLIDLLLVDGPSGDAGRVHFTCLLPHCRDGALIAIDDYQRGQLGGLVSSLLESGVLKPVEAIGRTLFARLSQPANTEPDSKESA